MPADETAAATATPAAPAISPPTSSSNSSSDPTPSSPTSDNTAPAAQPTPLREARSTDFTEDDDDPTWEALGDAGWLTEETTKQAAGQPPVAPEPAKSSPGAVPVPPATAPVATQPAAVQQPSGVQPPSVAATQPTAQQPAPQTTATETGPVSVETVLSAIESGGDWKAQVIQSFSLTKDQAEALETEPTKAIPALMGELYLRAVTTSLKYMQQLVPSMIAQQQLAARSASESENAFFTRWPQLTKEKHANDIRAFGKAFKTANPQATTQELIDMIGAAVVARHGLSATQAAPPATAPVRRASGAFVPAASSAPGGNGAVTQSVPDFFQGMSHEYE